MFLLLSGRHVGAHLDEHHHGVSIQISINLGKIFPRISRLRKIAVTWISVRVYAYSSSFYSQILDFIYWTVLIFILIWRATENQLAISFICNGINMIINIILLMLAFEQAFSIFPAKLLASVKIENENRQEPMLVLWWVMTIYVIIHRVPFRGPSWT